MIIAKSESWGADVSFINIAIDSKIAIIRAISESLHADFIITSGGVSVGEADFTKESFQHLGFEAIFEGVDIKPGKPTTFGKIGNTAVLNLPGNPSAGLINFEIFGKATILSLAGELKHRIDVIECEILEDLKVKSGKRTVVLGFFDGSVFRPLQKRSPGMVKPLIESNGFIILEKSAEKIESGSIVRFIPTSFQWTTDFSKSIITG
jgi:molybdopterin molybdotransferase